MLAKLVHLQSARLSRRNSLISPGKQLLVCAAAPNAALYYCSFQMYPWVLRALAFYSLLWVLIALPLEVQWQQNCVVLSSYNTFFLVPVTRHRRSWQVITNASRAVKQIEGVLGCCNSLALHLRKWTGYVKTQQDVGMHILLPIAGLPVISRCHPHWYSLLCISVLYAALQPKRIQSLIFFFLISNKVYENTQES